MRLLILGCSARKRTDEGLLSVLDRYDGSLWRVLRAFLRACPSEKTELDIYALSARHGLISADQYIENYDQRMTATSVALVQSNVTRDFKEISKNNYQSICLALSQIYLSALGNWENNFSDKIIEKITIANGSEGMKLHQLHKWLYNESQNPEKSRPESLIAPEIPRGTALLNGVSVTLYPDKILAYARVALREDPRGSCNYRDWYVLIDDTPVGAKWLVSVLTGISPLKFQAAAARRFLNHLGVSVYNTSSIKSVYSPFSRKK